MESNKQTLLHLILSSSSDDDNEVIKFLFNRRLKNIKPKINNYILDVVHNNSDKQVSSLIILYIIKNIKYVINSNNCVILTIYT